MIETIEIKRANTKYPVLDIIRNRFSPRSFSTSSISEEEMHTLIEAAAWAPSSMNEQPWRFIVARKEEKEKFSTLASFLMPGNKIWAQKAAVLMVVLGRTKHKANGRDNASFLHDVGMATQNLLLQAGSMDIHAHVLGGYHADSVREYYQLPEDLTPVTMIALGKLDHPDKLEEPFLSREKAPRTRLSTEELLMK